MFPSIPEVLKKIEGKVKKVHLSIRKRSRSERFIYQSERGLGQKGSFINQKEGKVRKVHLSIRKRSKSERFIYQSERTDHHLLWTVLLSRQWVDGWRFWNKWCIISICSAETCNHLHSITIWGFITTNVSTGHKLARVKIMSSIIYNFQYRFTQKK